MPIMSVTVDADRRTIQPQDPTGDDLFGLAPGTNGTAAATRRALIEASHAPIVEALGSLTWERHNGRPATGLQTRPSDRSWRYDANPGSGRVP